MTRSHKQNAYALALIDRKLTGQRRLDARAFVNDGRRGGGLGHLCDALKVLPDLDPSNTDPLPRQRRTHVELDPVQRERLCADRKLGLTYKALGEKYDVSASSAHNIARYVEVIPQPGYEPPQSTEIRKPSMATRQADSTALAKRCENVGWKTERSTKGIKVDTPSGIPYTIHLTYSDRRSLDNATADLKRLGLAEAEAEAQNDRVAERLRKIDKDRQANNERTQRLEAAKAARNKDLVLRAAGPYLGEPEDVPLSWFTEEHPAPWMRWVWLTPEIADYLLKHHNKPGGAGKIGTNRPQSETTIREYRDIIMSGQWLLTHQGMASDTTGMLQDGQHRLAALLAAAELVPDLKLPQAFFVGMPQENFKAIDEGKLRTATQLFAMGGEKNGGTIRSALRLIIAHKEGDEGARNRWRLKNTNAQLLDAFARDPQMLRDAAHMASSHAGKVPMGGGAFAALAYLLRTVNGADNRFVEAFLHGATQGTKLGTRVLLDDDDPRAALRRTLQQLKDRQSGRPAQAMDQLGLGILSWNFMVQGRHRQNLRWLKGTEIPQVLVCKDAPGAVPPRALVGEVDTTLAEGADNAGE